MAKYLVVGGGGFIGGHLISRLLDEKKWWICKIYKKRFEQIEYIMQLVIFAGGLGTRISEETGYVPKPMIKIGKQPVLWHIIKYYSIFGFSEFIICGGYKVKIIKNYFQKYKKDKIWNVKVINTGKGSNTGERLKRVKKYINNTFCLTYGDGLSNVNINKLINFHKKNKSIVTLTTVKPTPHFGKIIFRGNKVIKFIEKDQKKENWINGGFFVCEKKYSII